MRKASLFLLGGNEDAQPIVAGFAQIVSEALPANIVF
jgi:hypothetical protein